MWPECVLHHAGVDADKVYEICFPFRVFLDLDAFQGIDLDECHYEKAAMLVTSRLGALTGERTYLDKDGKD